MQTDSSLRKQLRQSYFPGEIWTQCQDGITCICETRSLEITPNPHAVLPGIYLLSDSETENEINVSRDCFRGCCKAKLPMNSTVFHTLSLKVSRSCAVLISATFPLFSNTFLLLIVPLFLSERISHFICLFPFSFFKAMWQKQGSSFSFTALCFLFHTYLLSWISLYVVLWICHSERFENITSRSAKSIYSSSKSFPYFPY